MDLHGKLATSPSVFSHKVDILQSGPFCLYAELTILGFVSLYVDPQLAHLTLKVLNFWNFTGKVTTSNHQ